MFLKKKNFFLKQFFYFIKARPVRSSRYGGMLGNAVEAGKRDRIETFGGVSEKKNFFGKNFSITSRHVASARAAMGECCGSGKIFFRKNFFSFFRRIETFGGVSEEKNFFFEKIFLFPPRLVLTVNRKVSAVN